jgi:RNAse (barnase) inhibitor barstar
MHQIFVDWQSIQDEKMMWDKLVTKSHHPDWHGRNLDALNDGWVNGGLDEFGPPYDFVFTNCQRVKAELKELSVSVMEIALRSVIENGGSIKCA